MRRNYRRRFIITLTLSAALGSGVSGCRDTSPAIAETVSIPLDANGPPSAAAADVKNPTVPPAIEPARIRPPVIDYGPSSAAAADAAQYKPR